MRIVAGIVVLLATVLAQPRAADACSCRGPLIACESLTEGVVFLGTPRSITRSAREDVVELEVTEAFTRTLGKTATVFTDPMACGYKFVVGTSYLVYAVAGRGGLLTVWACSRTAPADQATEDLAIARAVPTEKRKLAVVEGTVELDDTHTPLAGVEVVVRGTTLSAKTTKTGAFTLQVPVGTHRLDIASTKLRIAGGREVEISAPSPLACPRPRIVVAWRGGISGRLTDRKNRPLEGVVVVAVPRAARAKIRTSMTDADGRYVFADVSPGTYQVAVSPKAWGGVSEHSPYPTTAYPGAVIVPRGGAVTDISFQVPEPVPMHLMSGSVSTHDGTPVEGAMVNIVWSKEHSQATQTNGGGGWDMRVLHGSTVRIRACWHEAPGGQSCTGRDVTQKITKPTVVDLRLAR